MLKLLTLFLYVQMNDHHINLIDQKTENIFLLVISPFLADMLVSSSGIMHYIDSFLVGLCLCAGKMAFEYFANKFKKKE